MTDLADIFSSKGPLARAVGSYRPRPFQLEMARAVAGAIAANDVLVAEAGTGTGKTFAYLVPALLSGGKVIISTGTKTHQDQLFERDIPTVRAALKAPVTVALLKGRGNYGCHHHLERAMEDGRLPTREDARLLDRIARFARTAQGWERESDFAAIPSDRHGSPFNAIGMAFAPDGRLFFTERVGRVRIVQNGQLVTRPDYVEYLQRTR